MNIFQLIMIDGILFIFPMLIYVIYLSSNKNVDKKSKKIYFLFSLATSFFLIYNYGLDSSKLIGLIICSSIVLFLYLEDYYIAANISILIVVLIYRSIFNNTPFLLIGYILFGIIYLFKKRISEIVLTEIYIAIIITNYFLWIYFYNNNLVSIGDLILIMISCFFIINIIFLIYLTSKKIMSIHLDYKELQKEKQIRLSLFKITHEIKNPIAVCKGYLDMINTKDTKQVERYIPIIKSEIDRLLMLLQDFLLINKNNLDLDIMDFNMLIEDTIYKLKPLLDEKNIKLNVNSLDDEIFINGDYNRLSQVLINIIKNSIEAMSSDRSGIININSKINKGNYKLTIEDNGIGMNSETMLKMKEPFFTTKKSGSGLGVSLIYEIISAHNGDVAYESTYGVGTKVIISIPVYNEYNKT